MSPPAGWLDGGGAMGEVVRGMDWSRTALGPLESWPPSLRTTVSLALSSNFPISIAWGPRRIQIYNDGYWPICGAKHPLSMGQDFKECWFSAWPAIGEAFESASAGRTAFLENQRMFLDRYGYLEETFFTFSFSPIRDETGRVAGLFHPVTEMTAQSIAERRLGVVREISDETASAATVDEAAERTIRTLERHALDVPFALLYLFGRDAGAARLAGAAHLEAGSPAAPRRISAAVDDPHGWPLAEALRTGQPVVVERLEERFGPLDCGPYPESPRTALVLPILVAGMARPLAVLVAAASPRRVFDSAYRTFYAMLQETVGNALTNARSYEEERRRAESLAEIDRAKTTFFSNVSHEFRTPLTLMVGPLENVLQGADQIPGEQQQLLAVAHRNSLRLLKLVNSLLDFSRIEAGRVQASYEPTDLAALTSDLASNFRSACEKAGLALRLDLPPLSEPIHVDRDLWEKIVLNLMSNAFKFTLEGGIEVALEETADHAVLRVRDSGVGVPSHEVPRLFERFHRVEGQRGRTHEGTGIGLALVHELVKLHGGSIEIESEEGRGTTVRVAIPRGTAHLPEDRIGGARTLAPTATGAAAYVEEALRWLPDAPLPGRETNGGGAAEGAASAPPPSGERILFVDDNADMRDYVRRLLEPRFAVETAPDGRAALEAARRAPPDLVISDVMMPVLDGFGLLRALRDEPRTRSIPIILLSARAGEESRVEGLDAGADDYLIKPFSARELFARVDAQLKLARMRRDNELRFRELVDAAPAMLWVTETDHRCTMLSRAWTEYTGQVEEEGLGFGWLDVVHPEDRPRTEQGFLVAAERRESFVLDYRLRRADGAYGWVVDIGRPRYGDDGGWRGYIGSVIDIGERKRAEEALRARGNRLRLLWEAAGVILSSDDPDSMLHRLFSKIREQVQVDTYFNFMVAADGGSLRLMSCTGIDQAEVERIRRLEFGQAICGTVALEKRAIVATRIQSSDDPKVQLVRGYGIRAYACNPLMIGERLLGTLSFASRTRDAFTPDELEFFETISRYVTAAYRQMQLIAELREADRRKDQFLATLAHEVRNPLAPLRTSLEILRLGPHDPATVSETRAIMERQVHQLTRLVDDLLEVSRLSLGKLRLQPARVELAEIVRRAVESTQAAFHQAGHRLAVRLPDEPLVLHADALRLVQVLGNLLANAAKYTPAGGHVSISAERSGHGVRLAVADDGIGLERADLDRIFEMFTQIDRTLETGFKGLGIGLTLVRSLVELHGGRVVAESDGPGRGSRFVIHLPLAGAAAGDAEAPDNAGSPAADGPATRHRVLLVEDNADAARTMARLLVVLGHQVHVAADGREALRLAGELDPDVVLLDIGLPGLNGYDVAAALRALPGGHRPMIVAVTGWGQEQDRRRAREAGIDHHLTKPAEPAALRSLLEKVAPHAELPAPAPPA